MTVFEYNKEFLPKITSANCFISLFENIVSHIDKEKADHEEIWRIFKIYGWSEEIKQTILTALEYYRIHEGIEKLVVNARKENKMLSYEEYLERTGQDDSRTAWKLWKIEVCGMSEKEAVRASIREYVPLPKLQYPLYGVIQNWKGMKETNYLYTDEELKRFDPKLYEECNQDPLHGEDWHDSEKSPSAYVTWQGSRLNTRNEVITFLTGQFNSNDSCLSNNHWYWMNSDTNDLYGEESSTLKDACFEVFGGKHV